MILYLSYCKTKVSASSLVSMQQPSKKVPEFTSVDFGNPHVQSAFTFKVAKDVRTISDAPLKNFVEAVLELPDERRLDVLEALDILANAVRKVQSNPPPPGTVGHANSGIFEAFLNERWECEIPRIDTNYAPLKVVRHGITLKDIIIKFMPSLPPPLRDALIKFLESSKGISCGYAFDSVMQKNNNTSLIFIKCSAYVQSYDSQAVPYTIVLTLQDNRANGLAVYDKRPEEISPTSESIYKYPMEDGADS